MTPNTGKNVSDATDEVFVAPDPIPSFPVHAPFDAEAQAAARSRIDDIFAEVEEELRLEAERAEQERIEAELRARLERERLEAERIAREEAERLEAERQARLEAERLERERLEAERLEAERIAREEAERREREAAEAARREELARQLAAVAAASHMAHVDEEAFARLEDKPRRGAHFATPKTATAVEAEAAGSVRVAKVDDLDLDLDLVSGVDVDVDTGDLDTLGGGGEDLASENVEVGPSEDYDLELEFEPTYGYADEGDHDHESLTETEAAPMRAVEDEDAAHVDGPATTGDAGEKVSALAGEPHDTHETNVAAVEVPAREALGMGLDGVLADIFDYDDLDEVEDVLEPVVAGGRHVGESPRGEYDELDGDYQGAAGYATQATPGEAVPEEPSARGALPLEDEDAVPMRDVSGSAFADLDDLDEPEVVVIYDEVQIEEAVVDAPATEEDPGLEATLVLDRVAAAVKKLRVEGESAPVAQVREQGSEAEIHTEFQVSEDDKERLEVVRRDVVSAKGRQGSGFFARIGAFVVKALHLDER